MAKKKTATKPRKRAKKAAPDANDPKRTGDLAVQADETAIALPFEPTEKQLQYLFALRDALTPTGDARVNDTAMGEKCKVSRTTIWEWKHDPEFRMWLASELTRERDHDWDLVLDKHHQLAIRGSVRSAEFLAKVRTVGLKGGGFADSVENLDQSVTNYSVVLLSPRPPALPAPAEKSVGGGQA